MKLLPLLLAAAVPLFAADHLNLGDFAKTPWSGMSQATKDVPALPSALPPDTPVARWSDLPNHTSIHAPAMPRDLSHYTHLNFWLYSAKANSQNLTFFINSENPKSEGMDYYYLHLTVDWQGWRHFFLSLKDDLGVSRNPLGWNNIKGFDIISSGWSNTPLKDTTLYFADIRFTRQGLNLTTTYNNAPHPNGTDSYQLVLDNSCHSAMDVVLKITDNPQHITVTPNPDGMRLHLPPHEAHTLILTLNATRPLAFPARQALQFTAADANDPKTAVLKELHVNAQLPQRQRPFLFGSQQDCERVKQRAAKFDWARAIRDDILERAEEALKKPLVIPAMEGQWPHHYVCKKCGVGLKFIDNKHQCPRCHAVYKGWPYDQVRAGYHHGNNWHEIKLMGQAYLFTGREDFARRGRDILLGYAERYPQFAYHDMWNRQAAHGGRMLAQTLDEAYAIIAVAWGYDLLYNSPCFSQADHDKIADRFFREVARTILRNDSGISNWQSWHNAGIAAIGFCLNDSNLIQHAIFGKSGFLFQLQHSILKDGFWYEGTASYHFYALDALIWTAEAARQAGLDYTQTTAFISLFDAPLYYVMPDMCFPAINDGDVMPLLNLGRFYDWAYSRFPKPEYLPIATHNRKGDWSLFFGQDTLPQPPNVPLRSRNFNGLGALVMRQGDRYVHFDYGPHGGGHGHQDKLALNIYAAGQLQAPDPGRLAYAAPMQGSWYRQTVAHNTIAVDGKSQASTTGKLLAFHESGAFCLAQASCDTAYKGVLLHRTIGLCDGVFFDVFDAVSDQPHTYDWLYHNFGDWSPELPQPLQNAPAPGNSNGYQHIENARQLQYDGPWQTTFTQDKSSGRLVVNGAPGTTLIFGDGVANNPPTRCPLVVIRREGREARFVSCVDYAAANAVPRQISLRLLPDHTRENPRLELTIDGRKHLIAFPAKK